MMKEDLLEGGLATAQHADLVPAQLGKQRRDTASHLETQLIRPIWSTCTFSSRGNVGA